MLTSILYGIEVFVVFTFVSLYYIITLIMIGINIQRYCTAAAKDIISTDLYSQTASLKFIKKNFKKLVYFLNFLDYNYIVKQILKIKKFVYEYKILVYNLNIK